MTLPPTFDWQNPDYREILAQRAERLQWLRADPTGDRVTKVRAFYATDEGLAQFIDDWGMTFDPRLAELGLPTTIPFVLFDKQREFIAWALKQWRSREPGIGEKSRDWGLTWLAIALSCSLCLFREGLQIGFGSRKEEYVDSTKSPKAIFWKGRQFLQLLPPEFRNGWSTVNAAHMRLDFPATGSVITGEAGDNIGRGDRASLYWVDEAAFIERPHLIDASLSQTTNCRIDISTPKGMANPFAVKRHNAEWINRGRIFTAHWRDDPRKDEAWYARQQRDLDSVTLAQEVDLSYTASSVGIVIPQAWVQSCVDLHKKLGFEVRGQRLGAYDPADEGADLCAFADATGVLVNSVVAWSGKGSDTLASTQKVFALCDVLGITEFDYDSDGLGAGVRGDARSLNEKRQRKIDARAYRGSGAVVDPDKPIPDAAPRNEKKLPGEVVRLNADYFENAKAQAWFETRARFQRGHRALEMHLRGEDWRAAYSPDDLISLNSGMPELGALLPELSQATFTQAKSGKMMINKTPDGAVSPNRADAVVIRYAPARKRGSRYKWDAWKS